MLLLWKLWRLNTVQPRSFYIGVSLLPPPLQLGGRKTYSYKIRFLNLELLHNSNRTAKLKLKILRFASFEAVSDCLCLCWETKFNLPMAKLVRLNDSFVGFSCCGQEWAD